MVDEDSNRTPPEGERERRARLALAGYRERRRVRRGEDTYFGSEACLLPHVESGSDEAERLRRRSEILEEARLAGMSDELAELLHEIASEEGIDPALAFELVRCGLGVAPPEEGLRNTPSQPMADRYLPGWMFPPTPTDQLLRERMLRLSFRRLRTLLEAHDQPDDALRAFAHEPDVGHFGY